MIEFAHRHRRVRLADGESFHVPQPESYRDSPETTVREIVAQIEAGEPWRDAVAKAFAAPNPWLHRIITAPARGLFFRENPPHRDAQILDVGAGWGQISLPLARQCRVTAVEPTLERLAFIQAVAQQEGLTERMHFVQADLFDLEFSTRFDLVCCIGVLEWVGRFRPGDVRMRQVAFLKRLRSTIAATGRVVIGIENRFGLKYLLGSPDDHTGLSHISVLDRTLAAKKHQVVTGNELRVLTYTLAECQALLAEAGFSKVTAYAAYPDYKLPEAIISIDDSFESRVGEMSYIPEHHGNDGSPLSGELQEALASHYRTLSELGVARFFAPSFFFVGEGPSEAR